MEATISQLKKIVSILWVSQGLLWAACPLYEYKNDPQLNQELHNICSNISNVSVNTVTNSTPSGAIFEFAASVAPAGFYSCDGSTKSRTNDAPLFAAIGTTWGSGDGVTTFNIPNFQRRTPVGFGGVGTTVLGSTVGALGGEEGHILTPSETARLDHVHSISHQHDTVAGFNGALNTGVFRDDNAFGTDAANVTFIAWATSASGASSVNYQRTSDSLTANSGAASYAGTGTNGSAHNIIQPSAVVMFIIKR